MHKGRIIFLLLIYSLFIACASVDIEGNQQKSGAHYKIGIAYLNDGKIQQAFVEFQKAYELNPLDKEVLNAIGIIYLLNFDEPEKAIGYFENAVKVDPSYSEAYNNLGYANEKQGRFETAITYYKKALANLMYATADKAYINMGNAYYRLGNCEAALLSYKEAVKRAPNLSLPYFRMSLCYNATGKYGDASSAITHAISIDPVYKGDKEKAIEDLTIKKLKATGFDERDIKDYIEILKY